MSENYSHEGIYDSLKNQSLKNFIMDELDEEEEDLDDEEYDQIKNIYFKNQYEKTNMEKISEFDYFRDVISFLYLNNIELFKDLNSSLDSEEIFLYDAMMKFRQS